MPKRPPSLLALLSLLLFIFVTGMWVRSFLPERLWFRWVDGGLVIVGANSYWANQLGKDYFDPPPEGAGGVRAFLLKLHTTFPPLAPVTAGSPKLPVWQRSALGVEAVTVMDTGGAPLYRVVTVPVAYLALLSAVAPAWWFVALVRRRSRSGENLCANCGYDLRASPDRCPECGASAGAGRGRGLLHERRAGGPV